MSGPPLPRRKRPAAGRSRAVATAVLALLIAPAAAALDPPHDASEAVDCSSCHTTHTSPGGSLTTVGGNANLCLSCHVVGGTAAAFAFVDADQALPGPGLPPGTPPRGTSHRWDSGAAGHVSADAGNSSAGTVVPGGNFSGRVPKTYTLTVAASGDAGSAVFSWDDTLGGGASGVLTGVGIALDQGVTATFVDGDASPSFVAGDVWRIFVRTDLDPPATAAMAARLENGRAMCSTCHNQHSQLRTPFDPAAPAYGGPGTGDGRHFMRVDNTDGSMCVDCHSVRDVATSVDGSHPVGLPVPAAAGYQPPATLPLDPTDRVVCLTCHQVHSAATADGSLLRSADRTGLCVQCHTLADTASPASHLEGGAAGTLWPGGQYGSTFPAITDPAQQGTCGNCHQAHGWPDAGAPGRDYPLLQVDLEEALCDTCHDGAPAAASVRSDFQKSSIHPLGLASEVHEPGEPAIVADRHVECADCHDPHRATARVDLPGPATGPRPASGPLAGVRGVSAAGIEVDPADFEHELCFRCHADSPGLPAAPTQRQFPSSNVREEFAGSFASYHPVVVAGTNSFVPSLIAASGWTTDSLMSCTTCHNNDDGPAAGGTGANGPHGSDWPHLLERRYDTADDNSPYNIAKYALCFKCHLSSSIMGGNSFNDHSKHISGERTPCNVCHDPHASRDYPKLINFDTSVVSALGGTLEFVSLGPGEGECTLRCHGKDHNGLGYP
ncbi:MAG TPA: cytochrome c3 family protein [Candidatus Sulfomarinibacteraceae bacterium]|nr:cytochrome c3 family protein [Candidatus Sulfomarinibacteraceae bacterium]